MVEDLGCGERYGVILEESLEVCDSALKIEDVASRYQHPIPSE
jgi:hypothetical protein